MEHPNKKRNYFQVDLNNFIKGDRKLLLEFLRSVNLQPKVIKVKKSIDDDKLDTSKDLITYKKVFYSLIVSLIIAIGIGAIVLAVLNQKMDELTSYYSNRESLNDFIIYSLFIVPLVVIFIYTIYLSKKKYKSKLIVFSYILLPIMTILILMLTVMTPLDNLNYSKDYSVAQNIFEEANIYLPEEGLIVSERFFKINDDNLTIMPYTETHKILINKDLDLFEQSLNSNTHWVTEKNQLMKAKLNLFIEREADYYLIYNETADNYNSDDLILGLNKLYVFYYYFETNEVYIYEFYLIIN